MSADELRFIWDGLDLSQSGQQGYVRKRLPRAKKFKLYAAKKLATGQEAMILEVATMSLPRGVAYPSSRGFELSAEAFEPGRRGQTRLLLLCRERRYRAVFQTLCSDVVEKVLGSSNESEAVLSLTKRLKQWQAFLQRSQGDGLSDEQQSGLFGELHFLFVHLLPRMEEDVAVTAWRGPFGANQDFRFDWGSVEIKTTRSPQPHAFSVSNVAQLSDESVAKLLVNLTIVDADGTTGLTLPQLVNCVRERVKDQARELFEDALLVSGYLDQHAPQYTSPVYTVVRERLFEVNEGFPRLLASALPNGVEDVRYRVAVAACACFERSQGEYLDIVCGREPQ